MVLPFFSPTLILLSAGLERGEEPSRGESSRLIQDRLEWRVWQKSRQPVKPNRRKLERQIPVPQTPSASHPPAQHNAFRRRGARLQSRSFARENQSLKRSPTPIGFTDRC